MTAGSMHDEVLAYFRFIEVDLPDCCTVRKHFHDIDILLDSPNDVEVRMFYDIKQTGLMDEYLRYGRFLLSEHKEKQKAECHLNLVYSETHTHTERERE